MFRLIFSFRAADEENLHEEDCILAAQHIINGFKLKGHIYHMQIEKYVKPMVQLPAGVHCNIEHVKTEDRTWPSIFEYNENPIDSKPQHKKVMKIAKNFMKIEIWLKGTDITTVVESNLT